jgi:hypothetical protein
MDELERWRAEREEATRILEYARRALSQHGASIDVHAETIEEHEALIESHEALIQSEHRHQDGPERHDVLGRIMAHRHNAEHASHTVQRNLHEKIGARHSALMDQIKRLQKLLETP